MKTNIVSLSTEDTVDRAAEIFKNNAFHHIPVIQTDGTIVGIVSTSDLERISLGVGVFKIAQKEKYNDSLFRSLRIVDVMSKEMVVMEADQTLLDAYQIFWQGSIRCLPVVKDRKLVGVVSPVDIIETLLNEI